MWERSQTTGPIGNNWDTYAYSSGNGHEGNNVNKFGTRVQIRLHVNGHSWLKQLAPRDPEGIVGG